MFRRAGRLWTAVVLLMAVTMLHGCAASAFGQKRIPAVKASVHIAQNTLRLGDVAEVTLRLTALAEVRRAEASFILPAEMEFVSGDRSWQGPMLADQVEEVRLRLRLVRSGTYTLGGRVVILRKGGGPEEVAGAVLYFRATPSSVTWGQEPNQVPMSPAGSTHMP